MKISIILTAVTLAAAVSASAGDAPFSVKGVSESGRVTVEEGAVAYEQTTDAPARFSLVFDFPAWEPDTWVFMPACAYNGNRDARRLFFGHYPPYVLGRDAGLEPERVQAQVPALEPDGSGALEVTSGDMTTPCAGFFFPKARRGVLVFTEQEVGGTNLGFTVRAGSLRIDYPANRSEGYRFCRKPVPHPDGPLALAKGTKLRSRFRTVDFEAADVSAFLERFFRERKCLLSDARAPNGYTKELWTTVERVWNEHCWHHGAYHPEIAKWVPGWTGGPHCVYPLYRFGDEQTRERCRQTLDFMVRHQSKYGFYYGRVVDGKDVVDEPLCGPRDEPNRYLIRRSADGLYFLIRCGRQMGWTDAWKDSARRCADALVRTWRKYGQFGLWVDVEDGRILVGRSTSCAIAPAALYEAWKEFGDPAYREVALASCADYCSRDLDRGVTYGGPGDIIFAPDSESAFALLESCVVLAEETKDPQWLRRARQAAALCSTWAVSYRYRFPPKSEFAKLGVNTVGSVFASVQNKHSAPGICTLSGDSLLRLYRLTGDDAYLELCKDIAFFLPQVVSRADRPIVAYDGRTLPPGFIHERVNMSDWEGFGRIGEDCCGYCWCATSLLLTWADLVTQPEFTKFSVKGVSESGRVTVEEGAVAYEQTTDAPARFSLVFDFPKWEPDTWVFMPSCAYNGNRDARRQFFDRYPPYVLGRDAGLEPERVQSQVPALEPDGSGEIEVTSGDMATPCAGFFFPKARRGVLVFTEQEVGGTNLGFTVRAGSLRIDYPANRSSAYRGIGKPVSHPDRPLALAKGTKLRSRFRTIDFEAADVSAFLERFFRERKCLLSDARAPNGYTKELWETTEKAWNEHCWVDGAYRQEIRKWVPGWTGGPNSVYPLYRFGNAQTRERCRQTLDFMMRHQAKSGFFYGRVIKDEDVVDEPYCGPRDEPNRHLVRRSADALYFLIRCGRQMGWTDAWKAGARRCADAFVRTWRKYGQFGLWVDVEDGRILVGRSTSCALASAALYEAWKEFGDPAYREVALASCADYCSRDLDRGVTYGGPGDIIFAPDSESAFALLESCVVLAEETKDPQWLRRARQAAALCSTWVVSYRYRFPPTCTFAKLGVNTVGSVFASVQNKHAAPGICTASGDSLLRLYRLTGDAAYLELCKDIAFFLPQAVSRAERPIVAGNGRVLPPGFVSERVNMSDWEGFRNIGETFCAFCWCGTSLLTTWADLMTQPEFGAAH